MEEIRNQVLRCDRFTMVLFLGFGAIALLLVTIGVYGLISFSVQRAREIAVRISVGANCAYVLMKVLQDHVLLTLWRLAVGTVGVWLVTRAMRSILIGISATDFSMPVIDAALLTMTSTFATLIPPTVQQVQIRCRS
jgi:ABC-type antimicrobial peptide transport system permease subunit